MTIKFGENQTVENKSLTITDNFTLGGTLTTVGRINGGNLTINNNLIYTDGANVGIGTTNPSEKLDITGRIKGDNLSVGTDLIYTDGTNVGIGTTNPSEKLDISGRVNSQGLSVNTDTVYTEGTNVGIGTTNPTKILEVSGGQVLFNDGLKVVGNLYGDYVLLNQSIFALGGIDIKNGLFLTSNNNVGIGLYNPTEKLDVNGSVKFSSTMTVGTNPNTGTDGQFLISKGTNPMEWETIQTGTYPEESTNTLFVDNVNLRVGVGTTNPSEKLHIVGDVNISDSIRLYSSSSNAFVANEYYYSNTTNSTANAYSIGITSGGSLYLNKPSGQTINFISGGSGGILTATDDSIGIGTLPTEKLDVSGRIKGDNLSVGTDLIYTDGTNVGVGTTNPTEKLDITGRIKGDNLSVGTDLIYTDGTNFGVGTTNPTEKLDITGNIKTSSDLLLGGAMSLGTNYGTVGQVLTSQGTNSLVWQDPGGGATEIVATRNLITTDLNAGANLTSGAEDNVLLGQDAGSSITTANRNICIGPGCGLNLTTGHTNVNIGRNAGAQTNTNQIGAVSIGSSPNGTGSGGNNCVCIGGQAGYQNAGAGSVNIGSEAGRLYNSSTDGVGAINIGNGSGASQPKEYAVNIGYQAGFQLTSSSCVNIGREAGRARTGSSSINLGAYANQTNGTTHNRAIVINASGSNVPSVADDTFVVKPIRPASGSNVLYYDSGSGEITYASASGGGVEGIYSDGTNIGIGTTNPSEKLEVTGNIKTSGDLLLGGAMSLGTNYGTVGQVLTSQGTNPLVWTDAPGATEIVATRNLITTDLNAGANLTSGAQDNILLGDQAGNALTSQDGNVMLGYRAGNSTTNNNNTAIGYQSAGGNTNLSSSITIGHYAGQDSGNLSQCLVIGNDAGYQMTNVIGSTFLGYSAGRFKRGNYNVAVGYEALRNNTTNNNSVGIGYLAGRNNNGASVVCIGQKAGENNAGNFSILIGTGAGQVGGSFANTIVLNANSNSLNPVQGNSFFVKPIRPASGSNVLYYDSGSGEITYASASGGGVEGIYSDGTNIGIGTTNPSEKLHIVGDVNISDSIRLYSSSSNAFVANEYYYSNTTNSTSGAYSIGITSGGSLYLNKPSGQTINFLSGGSGGILTATDDSIGIGTLPTEKLDVAGRIKGDNLSVGTDLIYTDGTNIGIGTTNPSEKLHILGDVNISDSIRLYSSSSNAFVANEYYYSNTTNSTASAYSIGITSGGSLYLNKPSGQTINFLSGGSGGILTATDDSIGIGTLPTEKLDVAGRIKGDNLSVGTDLIYTDGTNVGIGTTNPSEKLHILGDVNISDSIRLYSSSSNAFVANEYYYSNTTNSTSGAYSIGITSGGSLYLNKPSGQTINFLSGGSGGILTATDDSVGIGTFPTEKLDVSGRIKGDNLSVGTDLIYTDGTNVGVGTTNPSEKLEVAGNIKADNLYLGEDGETPQVNLYYTAAAGAGGQTRILIGKSDDLPNGSSFPTFAQSGCYGIQMQSQSDGVFMGIEEYTTSQYRPFIQWGDDSTDTPFYIRSKSDGGATTKEFAFKTDGDFEILNGGIIASGNSVFNGWIGTTNSTLKILNSTNGSEGTTPSWMLFANDRISIGCPELRVFTNSGTTTYGTRAITIDSGGGLGFGSGPSYGTSGQILESNGPSASPSWRNDYIFAFAIYNGTTQSTVKSMNLTGSRTSTGLYRFTFTNAHPDGFYLIFTTLIEGTLRDDVIAQVVYGSRVSTHFDIQVTEQDNGGTAGVYIDRIVNVLVIS